MIANRRVAITGLGPITALGIGVAALWKSVLEAKSNVSRQRVEVDSEGWVDFPVAKIEGFGIDSCFETGDPIRRHLEQHEVIEDRDLLYLLAAVKLALADSGLDYDRQDNEVGLVLTHENPGVDHLVHEIIGTTLQLLDGKISDKSLSRKELIERLHRRFQKKFYNLQSFMYLYHVSKCFGLHGFSLFINNACASGLYALECASRQIQAGRAPAMIVAGADHPCFATKFLWFKSLGLYAEDGIMRPFDCRRNGFVFGDGGGAIVLEEMEHARRRGARIYAEYLGGGFTQDAWKVSVPSVLDNYYAKALATALKQADLSPGQLDLINPHGAATPIADRCEALAITEVLGEWPQALITAFKPFVGHNLGGSALVESILLLLSMQEGFVPPTLNLEQIDRSLKIHLVREPTRRRLDVVAKMSNGFAGYNAVSLFRRAE